MFHIKIPRFLLPLSLNDIDRLYFQNIRAFLKYRNIEVKVSIFRPYRSIVAYTVVKILDGASAKSSIEFHIAVTENPRIFLGRV